MYELILLLLLWVAPHTADRQENTQPVTYPNRLALHIESANYNAADLDLVRSAGFTILVFDSLDASAISSVPEDFLIFYNIGYPYLIPSVIDDERNVVIHELREKIDVLSEDNLNRISAIGLFNLPMENAAFHQFADLAADSLRFLTDTPFYYHSYNIGDTTPAAAFDFIVEDFFSDQNNMGAPVTPHTYFHPSDHYRTSVFNLEQVLNRSLQFEQSVLILPFSWIVRTLREQPGMAVMLQEHVTGNQVTLPLPASERPMQPVNGHLIIFWILVGGLVILIRYHPVIPQLPIRYYFNHSFFMQDIMEGRVRNPKVGFYFLGIQSLFTGLFVYCFMYSFYSEQGIKAIAHFAGWGIWNSDPAVSIAITAAFISILIHAISVSWLYLFIKDINQLYKAVNLYAWGLFAHLILTAILVGFASFSLPLTLVYSIGGIYYVLWVSAFLIASVHGTKKLEKKKYTVLFLTFGVYLILAFVWIILPLQSDKLIEIFQLAYQISN